MCDSDTVLDPACTVEMLRVLEEDPRVGGVGGDVQVGRSRWSMKAQGSWLGSMPGGNPLEEEEEEEEETLLQHS